MSTRVHTRLAALGLALGVLFTSVSAQAIPAQVLAQRAREAGSRGDWNQAADALQELVEAGVDSNDVLYNLGTAYAQAGRYGEALWRLEQVLRRAPFHTEAQQNLRAARLRLAHRDAGRTGRAVVESASGLREWLAELLSPEQAVALTVSAELLAILAWQLRRRRAEREAWRIGSTGALALSGVLVALGLCVVFAQQGAPTSAVVLHDGLRLLQTPAADALPAEPVREGDRVVVLSREGAFVRVRTPEGPSGWLPSRMCGVLE